MVSAMFAETEHFQQFTLLFKAKVMLKIPFMKTQRKE
jgi:hypothetical protein